MNRKYIAVLMLAIFAVVTIGCATGQKTFSQMSPKEKAAYAMALYNKQVDDYRAQLAGTITEDQKTVLRAKYEVFKVAWRAINAYALMAETGAPTPEAETALISILNQLAGVK